MRRRRQKNPLLMRIIGISIAVHIVALPVLAHFGAFKKIQQHFVEAKIVVLPPPPAPEKEKAEVKKQVAQKPTPAAKKGPTNTAHQQQGPKTNPNAPHIAMAQGTGDGQDTAEQGNGKQGVLPTVATDTKSPAKENTAEPVPDKPKTDVQAVKPAPPIKETTPVVKPMPPVEPPMPPVQPHEPVFTEAVATSQPQPTLPDDLRTEALDKTFVAEFTVGTDGMPAEIQVAQSTGNKDLDRLALDTAKRWRFKPATRDGQPIESHIRLHIEFQVD
ncbi:MAG TPA: energy transducer TonB [Chthonomonadaceae bacterium]|nr:energy transducer TonB [Chthonomonadaceae bacterium]